MPAKQEPDVVLIAADIAARVKAAQEALCVLELDLGERVLEAELGKPGADDKLLVLNQQITDASRKVSQLRAAHEIAALRDAATLAAARHRVRLSSFTDFENAVKARGEAAKKLASALAQASAAYRHYIERQQGLEGLLPLDVVLDHGEAATIRELVPSRIASAEMWRLGALPNAQGIFRSDLALPGAKADGITNINPDTMPTLLERVAANTEWILDIVRDRLAALAPAAAERKAA